MAGRLFSFYGEQARPREKKKSGRYFTYGWRQLMYPRQWRDEEISRWDQDMEWFDGTPPGLLYRGPWGSPVESGRIVEFDGYMKCQETKALDHMTDGHEEEWAEWAERWPGLEWVAYLGKVYAPLRRESAREYLRQLWLAVRPCEIAGVQIGVDSLSFEIAKDRMLIRDTAAMLAHKMTVWGESAPRTGSDAERWPDKVNIILVDASWNDVVKGRRVDIQWAKERGLRYMIWGLFTIKRLKPDDRVARIRDWLAEGYDVATNISWLRHKSHAEVTP